MFKMRLLYVDALRELGFRKCLIGLISRYFYVAHMVSCAQMQVHARRRFKLQPAKDPKVVYLINAVPPCATILLFYLSIRTRTV